MADTIELTAADGTVYLAEPAGAWDRPDGFAPSIDDPDDWDRSGVFYDDECRPPGAVPLYRLTATGSLELLSTGDIARRLGLSRPRVWQLRRRPGFPRPAGRYIGRDLWREVTIRRWAAATGRPFIEPPADWPKPTSTGRTPQ